MRDFRQYINRELREIYSDSEIRKIYFDLLEKQTKQNKAQLLAEQEYILDIQQQKQLLEYVARLKNHEPLQYILGQCSFGGLNLETNDNVLIPRPETEELLAWITDEISSVKEHRILDIGTGSGCIAIALKHALPYIQVDACEVSQAALQLAVSNAKKNKIEVYFFCLDILSAGSQPSLRQKYSVIVSNPPYICPSEKEQMKKNVLAYEPHLALFVPEDDPLLFYKKIADFALFALQTNGFLFFEINRKYAHAMIKMLSAKGFADIEVKKDLSGNDRMMAAKLYR